MTTNDIDAIRKLTDASTPGPWTVGERRCTNEVDDWEIPVRMDGSKVDLAVIQYQTGGFHFPHGDARDDAEFIAAARTIVPALCDEIEQLRAELADKSAGIERLIAFRNVKVWEADELAKRLSAVRALAEGKGGEDFAYIYASDILAALGESHPAESRPAVELTTERARTQETHQ